MFSKILKKYNYIIIITTFIIKIYKMYVSFKIKNNNIHM